MLVELPPSWIALFNIFGIPCIHLLLAWWSTRLPSSFFKPEAFLYRVRKWEQHGRSYQRLFRVRSWKNRLPDGAAWLSGFAKARLLSKDPDYLGKFLVETCRGEFSHWLQLLTISFFIIWNPFPANLIILTYAGLSNLPCIISQRHTRARLARIAQDSKPKESKRHEQSSLGTSN